MTGKAHGVLPKRKRPASAMLLAVMLLLVQPVMADPAAPPQTPPTTPSAPQKPEEPPKEPAPATRPTTPPSPTRPARRTPEPAAMRGLTAAMVAYGYLLHAVVTEDGLVRYHEVGNTMNMEMLENTVRIFGQTPLPEKPSDRLALWCNAYNANVLLMAYRESRKEGFRDVLKVEGFFDARLITVAGEKMTLNDLANKHIRTAGDPRVHAAMVPAARSAPPLRREPYSGQRLSQQLDDQCRRWINDPSRNRVEPGGLALCPVFDWFKDDFAKAPDTGVLDFVRKHAAPEGPIAKLLADGAKPEILWQLYDFSLNAAAVEEKATPAAAESKP